LEYNDISKAFFILHNIGGHYCTNAAMKTADKQRCPGLEAKAGKS
jgi:hypothetical protein